MLPVDPAALAASRAVIVNIDYPLGLAAYNILREVAETVDLRGVYVLGKAATLNADVGDVMISSVVHDEHSRSTYWLDNAFSVSDIAPYLRFGSGLDNQRAVSVKGTFLQNRGYLDFYYREAFTVVEMEAGPYCNAVYEMTQPVRYPTGEPVNFSKLPIDFGVIHYASDTPYTQARTLGRAVFRTSAWTRRTRRRSPSCGASSPARVRQGSSRLSLVSLRDVGVAFGAESILEGVTFRVETRQRIAVVGANGAGKTTLLTLISGALEPTQGEVEWQRGLRIGYLPQDAPEPVAETILDEVMASREDLAAMHHEMTTLEPLLADSARPDAEKLLQRYGDVQHRYIDQGGYELEATAREALGGLGLDTETQQRHPSQLSGGQKRRLELAKLLVQDADLLLIDEPTNHLDLAAIEWLEDFMRGVSTAFVLVSHDRRFLDNVCTQVIEVAGGTIEEYPGNYTQYTKLRVERRERRRREFAAQKAYIDHQEEFIRKYKAGQRAREARGRQTRLNRLERVAPPTVDRKPRLRFSSAPASRVTLKGVGLIIGRDAPLLSCRR